MDIYMYVCICLFDTRALKKNNAEMISINLTPTRSIIVFGKEDEEEEEETHTHTRKREKQNGYAFTSTNKQIEKKAKIVRLVSVF